MKKKKRQDRSSAGGEAPPNNPFAALAGLRDDLPPGENAPVEETTSEVAPVRRRRAIVRRERKGRGGKTVTLIERTHLDDEALRALERDLGVGARREGSETVVVQGDLADRVHAWLAKRE